MLPAYTRLCGRNFFPKKGALLFSLTLLAFLGGCTSGIRKPAPVVEPARGVKPSVPRQAGARKVGLLLPLSGTSRALGKSLQNAAELAFFESSHDGMELIIEDTHGTPEGAQRAVTQALHKGAGLILGPLFASSTLQGMQVTFPHKITMLSFTNHQKAANASTFVLGFNPQEQIERVLSFARQKGKTTLVAFVPQNEYGVLVEKTLQYRAQRGLLTIKHLEKYDPRKPSHFSKKRLPPADILLVAEGGHNLSRIVSALLYHENPLESYQIVGTGQWDTPETRSNRSLIGAWFASPDPQARLKFEAKFQQTYGYFPPRLATLAYDTVSLIAALTKRHPNGPFPQHALTQGGGFTGLDGLFRLRPDGTVERGLAVLEVHAQGFRVLDPGPSSFQ